jgi:hypothetical protein
MMQRQIYDVNTDNGVWTDSGPSFHGEILQARWEATSGGDTGDDLAIWLQQRPGDTGNGVLVVAQAGNLNTDFTRCWRQPTHLTTGAVDTGADQTVPVVSAGEHLRVRVSPGGASLVGKLYIWTKD